MRLIDADKLHPDCLTKDGTLAISQSQIANAPTVDLKDIYQEGHLDGYTKAINEERPQGEWKHNNFDEHYCNKCGSFALWSEEADDYYEVRSNFCPNCGADMRKEKEE